MKNRKIEYPEDKLYKLLITVEKFRFPVRTILMGLYKASIIMIIFIYNGLNIPIFNRWSVLIRGESQNFFSAETFKFALGLLFAYLGGIFIRNLLGYRLLNNAISVYLMEDVWKRDEKKQNELDTHYSKLQSKYKYPTSIKNILTTIYRDLDMLSFLWTLPVFPIAYNLEAVIPEIKMLYQDDSNKMISYRAAKGVKDKKDLLWTFTMLMFCINEVIPVALAIWGLKYFNSYERYPLIVLGLTTLINAITYKLIKYKHLSIWLANDPINLKESDIKESKKKNPFNWKSMIDQIKKSLNE